MVSLNERLKSIRKERNCKQLDVANDCKIALRSYKYYESGERVPDANILTKLADYFDVSTDYLTGRCDNPDSHKC